MDIKLISDNKTVNIEHEIINKNSGTHYINVDDRQELGNELDRLYKKGIFDKYKMSYTYTVHDDYIVFLLYKTFEFII
ncbi:hypothetical protein CDLVIII_0256 [Clostridium sp. DL-VIII]|uniref:hypothetical protein n=1 Tax=Clostridium sp. DL-VIII TaxID=641107 RepID=UPI00023AF0E5|nr:hypothetical protein [Clostridium sp. DL-VIII]EHI96994.1 hypothetical protein CDLVIII_0256 [Clostridium sp. DL-VIII]